jgi:type II secretory pathway pseudopilin PulG
MSWYASRVAAGGSIREGSMPGRTIRTIAGMTVLEILVGMAIFAIGCFTLTQVIFGAMQSRTGARRTVLATSLAHEKMAEIMRAARFNEISEWNFPNEDYGSVAGGSGEYGSYRRTVSIADSTDAHGRSILKDVKVEVEWRENGKRRSVSLHSSIMRADALGQ